MSKESEFTFRMGDHEVTMRESFAMMYQAEQLFDCALVCHQMFNDKQENKDESNVNKNKRFKRDDSHKSHSSKINIVKAHKVVLASSSDYFQNLFSSIDKLEPRLSSGMLVLPINAHPNDIKLIIEFIYRGQVSVAQSKIPRLLKTAQYLGIKGLMNIKLVNPEKSKNISENDPNLKEPDSFEMIKIKNLNRQLELDKQILEKEVQSLRMTIEKCNENLGEEKKQWEMTSKKYENELKVSNLKMKRLEELFAKERNKVKRTTSGSQLGKTNSTAESEDDEYLTNLLSTASNKNASVQIRNIFNHEFNVNAELNSESPKIQVNKDNGLIEEIEENKRRKENNKKENTVEGTNNENHLNSDSESRKTQVINNSKQNTTESSNNISSLKDFLLKDTEEDAHLLSDKDYSF